MQWKVDYCFKNNCSKTSHFNVVLLSIDHYSRKHDVATRFSHPQGENNQMVGFFGIRIEFFIKIGWLPDCPLLKKRTDLLRKKHVGWPPNSP